MISGTTTTITWHRARRAKRSGYREHRFAVSGPHTREVEAWLRADNLRHGEWRLPEIIEWGDGHLDTGWLAMEAYSLSFELWQFTGIAAASKRTTEIVTRFKRRWSGPGMCAWSEK